MAQNLESSVLTLDGFTPMASLKEGSSIIDTFGKEQFVVGVEDSDPQPLYEVATQDSYVGEFTGDHPWTVYDAEYKSSRVVDTQYMMDNPDEDYILPKPNLTTFHHKDRVMGRVFSPTALGLMLRETEPVRNALTLTAPSTKTAFLQTPPDYALATIEDYNKHRFVWEEESILNDPAYPWLREANLLDGKYENFRIPSEYLNSSMEVRSDLVYALTGTVRGPREKRWGTELKNWDQLPLDHPRFGKDLRLLTVSLSLHKNFTRRRVVRVTATPNAKPTRALTISSETGLYVTDGFMVTRGLKG